jgi:hypothetical protein
VRYGYTPDEVDQWPIGWSTGWLLERAMELEFDQDKWKNQRVGFVGDSADYDAAAEPPDGWQSLPMIDADGKVVVSDGE